MEDYSKYLKAELVEFLNQRDATIKELEAQIQTLTETNTQYENTIGTQLTRITTLEYENSQITQSLGTANSTLRTCSTKLTNHVALVNELQAQIDDYERGYIGTAKQIVGALNGLPSDEAQVLQQLIRTQGKGIDAFIVFNYGKTQEVPPKQLPKEDAPDTSKDDAGNAPTAKK